ncbi:MAG: RNA-binding S4 domain-containing protein [Erysipelotrichaceae bacterium]|nr:RNA-binding S4 domain-containing protein [Erysipelotrichaceae bacterium]
MRIDKFLKVSHILKRRTISKELALNKRIEINGRVAKPSTDVKVGDEVTITFGNRQMTIRVLSVEEIKRKKDAVSMYEVINEDTVS